jgi:pyruvate ferredoxin oxidoreductase alpha subunit
MDASFSMGSEGSIGLDLKAKLFGRPQAPMVVDFVAGLGGREINTRTVHRLVARAEEMYRSGQILPEAEWVDLDQTIV